MFFSTPCVGSYMRTWKLPNSSWNLSQAAHPIHPCRFCIPTDASLYVHPWIASLQKEYLVCCGHSYILLIGWMNEWNENKNILTIIVVVVYSRCDCLYQTKRTISEDEDSILPVVHIPYSLPVGSWLFLCAFEILLMFLICVSYGRTMGSSLCCHTHSTHTHTLRSWDWDTAEEPVLNLQGASQVLCWRSGTSDKAKPEILVWRCLWDILPTIFFNQAILLLRNLQWRPSFSRKKKKKPNISPWGHSQTGSSLSPGTISYYTPTFPSRRYLLCSWLTRILPLLHNHPLGSHSCLCLLSVSLFPHCTQPSCDHPPSIRLSEILLSPCTVARTPPLLWYFHGFLLHMQWFPILCFWCPMS